MTAMVVLFFSMAYLVGAAPTWKVPIAPPTDVSALDSPIDFSNLVSKSLLQKQTSAGPIHIDNNGDFPAHLGYQSSSGPTVQIGTIGDGETSVASGAVPAAPVNASVVGIYGYAAGGSSNYGLYAYSPKSVALAGAVTNGADFAGKFYGTVHVRNSKLGTAVGSLNVQQSLTALVGFTANSPKSSVAAIQLDATAARSNTTAITGTLTDSTVKDAGVFGRSQATYGVYVTAENEAAAVRAQSATSYGVYGYSDNGNGIIGEGDPSQTNGRGIYGESVDYGLWGEADDMFTLTGNHFVSGAGFGLATSTLSGVGVFACGAPGIGTAGDFASDIRILGSLQMGVGLDTYVEPSTYPGYDAVIGRIIKPQVTITEPMLQHAVAWCIGDDVCVSNSVTALP